jgi:acetyl esterase/lipase
VIRLLGRRLYPAPYRDYAAPGPLPVVTYEYGTAGSQSVELRVPARAGPHPVVVLIHGGFWRRPWRADLMNAVAVDLALRGVATWNLEYRRLEISGGGWPGTFEDVAAGIDTLASVAGDHALDTSRVVTAGHSAGGQLALWVCAAGRDGMPGVLPRVRPVGVVSLAGIVDLSLAAQQHLGGDATQALLGGDPDQQPERYRLASPSSLLPLGVPQLLVHGELDEAVPPAVSDAYAVAALSAGDEVELLRLPGVAHAALIDPLQAFWQPIREWLGARLGISLN